MDADRPGDLDAGGKQESGPVDRVKPKYIFPYQMNAGPVPVEVPIFAVTPAQGSYVVGERIPPDIDCMRRVARNRDTPLDRNAAYREILEPAGDERDDFVAASLGLNEVGPRSVELEQGVLHLGKLEEIAFLGDAVQRLFMDRTQRLAGVVVDFLELIAIAAVPAVVFALVDVSAVLQRRPKLLDSLLVVRIRGSHPPVVFNAEMGKSLFELLNDLVDMPLNGHPTSLGRAFDVDAVLVRAG